jgi:hypothetical protein
MSPRLPPAEIVALGLEKLDRASVYDHTLFSMTAARLCSQFRQICVHRTAALLNPVFDLVSARFNCLQLLKPLVDFREHRNRVWPSVQVVSQSTFL